MSTQNVCFGSKIRKLDIPLQIPIFYIQVGFKGVHVHILHGHVILMNLHFKEPYDQQTIRRT